MLQCVIEHGIDVVQLNGNELAFMCLAAMNLTAMHLTAMCGAREKTPCGLSSASGRSMVEVPALQVLKENRPPVTCRFILR